MPQNGKDPRESDEMSLMESIYTDAVEDPRLLDGVDEGASDDDFE